MRELYRRLIAEERRAVRVASRVAFGVWNDGFIHAGNLAYLSMLSLFPFFVIVGAVAGVLGRSGDSLRAVTAFLETLPPAVRDLLAKPIVAVITNASTGVITFSVIVGLWTAASYIETIRDILARAYRSPSGRPIWQRRLGSFALIIGSVIVMLLAFAAQVLMVGIEQFVVEFAPWAERFQTLLDIGRFGPMIALALAIYLLFLTLTPRRYRRGCPKLPGAAVTSTVWIGATLLLPWILGRFGSYDTFYGPLAGVMVALLFFFVVGLGLVVGAELNAALAQEPRNGQKNAAPGEQAKG
jgi:membrane protein